VFLDFANQWSSGGYHNFTTTKWPINKKHTIPISKIGDKQKCTCVGGKNIMPSSVCNGERCKINNVHAMMFTLILLSLQHNHMSNYKFVLYVTICISKVFNA